MNPFARSPKPATCRSCPLETAGAGFVPPSGPPTSKVLFVGESPGQREADTGIPFSGPAGGKFGHLLYRLGRERAAQRVTNLIWCKPPGDKLENTSYQHAAISQCRTHLKPVLEESHQVVVALGAVPARDLLGTPSASIKDLHGTVTKARLNGHDVYVVPTFHPSHLIRGAHNLTGTVYYDLNRAFEIADSGGWDFDEPKLHLDPSPEFFSWWVDQYLELLRLEPHHTWLAVDIETPDKQRELDEGELKSVDRSMEILRVNFSYDAGEGLTVPFLEPYVTIMRRALEADGPKWYWNKPYDLKRLKKHFKMSPINQLDGMDAWKALHSDTPRGLGFVAPFYSRFGPWKHLSGVSPELYAAIDSVQTIRCAFGLAADLHSEGRWDVFFKHMHEFGVYATLPACDVGLMVDRRQLEGYEDPATGAHVPGMQENLQREAQDLFDQMQTLVPDELKPLHPKDGWTERPEGDTYVWPREGEPNSRPRFIIEKQERRNVKVCLACGCKQRVTAKHRCKGADGKPSKDLTPNVQNQLTEVPRYYVKEDFNPASPLQVMAYIKWAGHVPGRNKGKETTNRETIERLADGKPKNKRDERARELYLHLLDYRDIKKVQGTYVEGTLRRLAADREAGIHDNRLHATVTNNPSTLRTAMADPNLQNVVADRRGGKSLSAGFRRAIVAAPGCKLVELDWSSIEAVLTGWCMGDPDYIRKAWTGIHDHLLAKVLGRPVPDGLSVDEVLAWLTEVKEADPDEITRNPVKRTIHGSHYGLTPYGMAKRFRKLFPSAQYAEKLQNEYYAFVHGLGPWQGKTQELAYDQEYLGGAGAHPFGYRHEFYNVRNFEPITEAQAATFKRLSKEGKRVPAVSYMNGRYYKVTPGEDAKRALAFFPQSIAAGVIRETALLLFKPGYALEQGFPDWYIGDRFFGMTPLRAIIHDSFLLELPEALVEAVVAIVAAAMTRMIPQLPCPVEWGLGPSLQFGVAVKVGENWAPYNDNPEHGPVNLAGMKKMKVRQPWLELLRGEAAAAARSAMGTAPADDVVIDEVDEEDETGMANLQAMIS